MDDRGVHDLGRGPMVRGAREHRVDAFSREDLAVVDVGLAVLVRVDLVDERLRVGTPLGSLTGGSLRLAFGFGSARTGIAAE